MDTSGDPFAPYFYLHLPFIYDLGVMVPFTYLETECLTAVNVAPSLVTPIIWGILMAFQIVFRHLGLSPFVRVLLYFFRMEFLPNNGWVTLHPFSRVYFLNPFSNLYEDWNDKFSWIRGIDNVSSLWWGREASPCSLFLGPLIVSST